VIKCSNNLYTDCEKVQRDKEKKEEEEEENYYCYHYYNKWIKFYCRPACIN
jgi:hypothetical protein